MSVLDLAMQGCETCGRRWQATFAGCPYCGAATIGPQRVPARGVVYSWVEVCRSLEDPPAPVPYTVVCVDLEGGGRVVGRYGPGGDPEPGEAVAAGREHGGAPVFAPAGTRA